MKQLTLRTLLAYIDDTLDPATARQLGTKVAESEVAQELIERIKRVTRRRGLKAPSASADDDGVSDPNTVAEYLSNSLESEQVTRLEETCLESDSHLAEVAACHQILTLILTEPVRVPPLARQRMYKLVKSPASDPNRRSSTATPIVAVAPEPRDADPDDADAAFLLGFGRYSTASVMKRMAAVAAIVLLTGLLCIAIVMALPGTPPAPPDTDHSYAANATPTPPAPVVVPPNAEAGKKGPDSTSPGNPESKGKEPEASPKLPVAPAPKPAEAELVKGLPKPRADRAAIGKVETLNVIVLTRPNDAPRWVRLDPTDEAGVTSADPVLCLPGYKADVQLNSGVKIHLWGNLPELLPEQRLLESKVRFHVPQRKADGSPEDFDADITLLSGRIYLSTVRAAGAKVRVRFADQVWDVSLPDSKAEVMIESVRSFDPGTPFSKDGGALPRVEVQAAVVKGTAGIAIPDRFKSFPKIAAKSKLAWDSKTGALLEPKPIEEGNGYYDRFLLVAPKQGREVQKALSEMAGRLKQRDGIRNTLAEILTEAPAVARIIPCHIAVYGQAAIAYGGNAADDLKTLIDLLNDEMRGYARYAAVGALAAWIPQAPGNTALLNTVLAEKLGSDKEAEIVLRLLRGPISLTKPDPKEMDKLVDLLNHPSVAIRELALWDLVNYVDPTAPSTPALITDVAQNNAPTYERFLKAWRTRIEEVKAKNAGKK